jgi:NOL1/NOP2/fmu family ribosome biogenesis protein
VAAGWHVLNSRERKELVAKLAERYGYSGELDYAVFRNNEGKHYLANRAIEEFLDVGLYIERVGVYFGQDQHGEFRFTIEGSQLVGPKSSKGVVELTPAQRDQWMLGHDIQLSGSGQEGLAQIFYLVKCGEDWLGCGKAKNGALQNYVPKERYVGATFPDATEDEE